MRVSLLASSIVGLLLILAGAMGSTCNNFGGSTFPKSAAWNQHTVNTGAGIRPGVVATLDFDADGKLDVVAGYPGASSTTAAVFIFFQIGSDDFTPVQIASTADLTGVDALAVGDLDGDGHPDIVAACSDRLVYLHSPPNPRSTAWTESVFDQSSGSGITRWNDVLIANIDRANGLDLVACNESGRVSWFKSPAATTSTGTGWTRIDIDATTRASAAGVAVDDFDGDGRLDVISTAPQESSARVVWYQNPNDPVAGTWTKNTVGNLPFATRVAVGDLDADGRSDVIALNGPNKQVGWYIRPSPATGAWTGYLLAQYSDGTPVDMKVAAIDGNDQLDLVVASQSPPTLRWFTPVGDQKAQWVENNLHDLDLTPGRIAVGDINGNGRPDVIVPLTASDSSEDTIVWFENPE